ncbi:hypothetical protein AUJ65_05075 [Candidatus Micrarchaeota archaeon CG1_02_51_15]|nr:MAG: hypothetical protein AUJ65_05075 [Candidatus Micrarchaeota archaeon CG1_02_51_15]
MRDLIYELEGRFPHANDFRTNRLYGLQRAIPLHGGIRKVRKALSFEAGKFKSGDDSLKHRHNFASHAGTERKAGFFS